MPSPLESADAKVAAVRSRWLPGGGWVLALVLGVIASLSLAARSAPPAAAAVTAAKPPSGFVFCTKKASPSRSRRDEAAWNYPLVFALLVALTPEERKSLGEAVLESNQRWDIRANPMVEDLEGDEPDAPLAAWLERAPASAATALAAARTRYCGVDGLCVRVAASGSRCHDDETPASSPRALGRSRFLAWPFGYALWLRASTPGDAARASASLRARTRTSDRIGLVLHAGDDLASQRDASSLRDELVRHEVLRRRAMHDSEPADEAQPFRVGDDENAAARAFPAELGPLDVLVLPRLETLPDPDLLARDVRDAAPGLNVVGGSP